jgi:hypothetical protein
MLARSGSVRPTFAHCRVDFLQVQQTNCLMVCSCLHGCSQILFPTFQKFMHRLAVMFSNKQDSKLQNPAKSCKPVSPSSQPASHSQPASQEQEAKNQAQPAKHALDGSNLLNSNQAQTPQITATTMLLLAFHVLSLTAQSPLACSAHVFQMQQCSASIAAAALNMEWSPKQAFTLSPGMTLQMSNDVRLMPSADLLARRQSASEGGFDGGERNGGGIHGISVCVKVNCPGFTVYPESGLCHWRSTSDATFVASEVDVRLARGEFNVRIYMYCCTVVVLYVT